jgi:CHAT domain-containing protein
VGLAGTLAQLANQHDALDNAVQAEDATREHLRRMLRYLPERQSLSYAATRPKSLDLMLSLINSRPDAAGRVVDELVRGRALVLDEMATRGRVSTGEEGAGRLRTMLNAAERRLANLVVRGPGNQSPAQYQALLADARREKEVAERALAEHSADARAELSRAALGIEDVQRALPSGAALLSFVRYRRTISTLVGGRALLNLVPSYIAFLISPTSVTAISLGPAARIETMVSSWHQEASGHSILAGLSMRSAERLCRVAGLTVRHHVWDPIAAHLDGVSHVFIVPDGALNLVNFSALPVGEHEYLAETGPVIHLLSTERDLVPTDSSRLGRGLLAVGDPAYDAHASSPQRAAMRGADCTSLQALHFESLPAARAEVHDISRIWTSASNANNTERGGATLLEGSAATKAAVIAASPGKRVLHLATHGFFLGGDCEPVAAGSRGVGGLAVTSRTPTGNPLHLSGLAFAGANVPSSRDSGVLTAEEVTSLNLQGTEWAVLAACDAGIGDIRAGEGVFGLRRAFQIAGVRTIIMSLWGVDDVSTRQWMRALYEGRFQQHLSTADAVRHADVEVLRSRRAHGQSTHPFYWAAFVAAGDWH